MGCYISLGGENRLVEDRSGCFHELSKLIDVCVSQMPG